MPEPKPIRIKARGLGFGAWSCGEGPLVLCLHGFPDCNRSYHRTLPALADAGFQAVAPALRGYDPDCLSPDGDYHPLRAAEDAAAIVRALGHERAHLVGHDWGACVAYIAARLEPALWTSITTIAVPDVAGLPRALRHHPGQAFCSWYMAYFQLPVLPERHLPRDDFAFIEQLWRDWSPGWALPEAELAEVKATLARPGVLRGALGYYRSSFRPSRANARASARLARQTIDAPLLAFTGALDGCMLTGLYEYAMHRAPRSRVERFDDAGHFLHQERPDRFNDLLIPFLKEPSP